MDATCILLPMPSPRPYRENDGESTTLSVWAQCVLCVSLEEATHHSRVPLFQFARTHNSSLLPIPRSGLSQGPMACEDVRGVSGEASKAWISRPALGKHICFDGRYLHAAPADLALPPSPPAVVTPVVGRPRAEKTEEEVGSRSETNGAAAVASGSTGAKKRDKYGEPKATARPPAGAAAPVPAGDEATAAAPLAAVAVAKDTDHDGQGGGGSNTTGGSDNNSGGGGARRVTFLVNVWLNHAPRTAVALPEETAKTLGRPRLAALLAPGDFVPPKALRIRGQEPAAETTTATATAASPGDDGGCRGSGGEPEEVGAAAAAVEMRWEFGEVGGEAETHLRHEVLVPVPGVLVPCAAASDGSESRSGERLKEEGSVVVAGSGAGVGVGDSAAGGVDGGSFCVEYPSASSRPRVSRMGADDDEEEEEEEEGSSSEEEDEESEEDEEEEEEENSSSEEDEDAKPAVDR